jgi:HD-GYP domain-containing protein (c-di-GMP phosphodiesterase class II)
MRTTQEKGSRYVVPWVLTWSLPAAAQLLFASAFSSVGIVGSPTLLFWIVVLAAAGCALTSGAVIGRGVRRKESELVYMGLFFMSVSILPLVHGITTPGVLYGDNTATMSSVQWSIPVALLVAAPLLFPRGMRLRHSERLCRPWTVGSMIGLLVLAAALLIWTNLLPLLDPRSLPALVLGTICAAGCIALSYRHLYLAQVAGSRLPLVISMGFGFVGGSALVWFGAEPFSAGFWVAHLLDICGVFAGTIGALVTLRSTAKIRATIEPVLATEPMAALELGMDPIVHKFVSDLEARDTITRDHVVRTAELAVNVGTELGLHGRELRKLGLTALLHDVGKLDIPTSIINKPGRLDEDEYNVMKRHAAFGQAMVETSPALAEIGIFIRGHHERIDGNGYPDGRSGRAIPLISRIVAVCDAFDAMANTRQYRDGMGVEKALAILREHAGTQWDADVVVAAERVIERDPLPSVPAFDQVGRDSAKFADHDGPQHVAPVGCDCLPVHAMAGADEQHN